MLRFVIIFISLLISHLCFANVVDTTKHELSFKGVYLGENLYVINPMKLNVYSVKSVFMNGTEAEEGINSSAFEIDLSKLKIEDSVFINVVYDNNIGVPIFYNPEAFIMKKKINFTDISTDRNEQTISWTIEGDDITESFEIEHFVWDNWMTVVLVDPKEVKTFPNLKATIIPHSGRNTFRIKYIDIEGNEYYSSDIRFNSKSPEVSVVTEKFTDIIAFSDETMFQLYNDKGALIDDGYSKSIDISEIKKGNYFLNYDNKTLSIKKR